jgi:1-acyl-sn-glycerol-3-phosphate acyltransferase
MKLPSERQLALPSSTRRRRRDASFTRTDLQASQRSLLWKYLQVIARVLTTTLFDLKVYGLENIPKHHGALIVSNHQSYLDPVVLGARLRRPLGYIAKEELFEVNPAFTWLLRSLGAFPVRQGRADLHALKESIERLHEGYLLNIYPEGARTPDGKIGKIEKGIALINRRAHVPIIPAVIVGSFEAWPIYRRFPQPRPIRVHFGPPMELTDMTSPEILATIDRTLRKMFDGLSAGPPAPTSRHPAFPDEDEVWHQECNQSC